MVRFFIVSSVGLFVPKASVKILSCIVLHQGMVSNLLWFSVVLIVDCLPFFLRSFYLVFVNLMSKPFHFVQEEFGFFLARFMFAFLQFVLDVKLLVWVLAYLPDLRLLYRPTMPVCNILVFGQFFLGILLIYL